MPLSSKSIHHNRMFNYLILNKLVLRKYSDVVQITDKSNTISKALGGAQGLAFVHISVIGTFKACDPKYVVQEAKHS